MRLTRNSSITAIAFLSLALSLALLLAPSMFTPPSRPSDIAENDGHLADGLRTDGLQAPAASSVADGPNSGYGTDPTTGEVAVAYVPGQREAAIASAQRIGATVTDTNDNTTFILVKPPADVSEDELVQSLSDAPGIHFAEPVYKRHILYTPSDAYWSSLWNMRRVGGPDAWDITRGNGIKVAVVDTGIQTDHPDLAANIDPNKNNHMDFVDNDRYPYDGHGHGTHVAGIIGAVAGNGIGVAGIANQCTLLPIRTFDNSGNGSSATCAAGVRWAADHGAKVINMSFGSPKESKLEKEACEYAVSKGCILVASCGNGNEAYVYPALFPARYASVLGVSSTNEKDGYTFPSGSSPNYGPQVDISAPGADIYSTYRNNQYRYMSGTSMAAPMVSGVAALVAAKQPSWTAEQIRAAILATAEDIGASGYDDTFGFGVVRPDLAVALTAPPAMPSRGDADIPGVPMPKSPVNDSLRIRFDMNDVYAVELQVGEMLGAKVVPGSGLDAALAIYGPDAKAVDSDSPLVESREQKYTAQTIQVTASRTGTYYVRVSCRAGQGDYELTYGKTSVDLTAPTRAVWDTPVSLTASVDSFDGPIGGTAVSLQQRPISGNGNWVTVDTQITGSTGTATFSRKLSSSTQFRVLATIQSRSYTSDIRNIALVPLLTIQASPTASAGTRVTVTGELNPAGRQAGGKNVWIRCYKDGSLVKIVRAKDVMSGPRGDKAYYRAPIVLDAKGIWTLRAYVDKLPGLYDEYLTESVQVTVD
ncbi:MAG: S8 family peptidase [Coriobacteriia bacterium]|nr:S8 family peptidase [Coriobacteriia bacterium]